MAASHHVTDLLKFLETAGQKGWVKAATASALKGACERVLGALDEEEKVDVAGIDVDAALTRFGNKNGNISPQSLGVYGSRIRSAIKMFTEAKANPTSWKPPTGRSTKAAANGKTETTSEPREKLKSTQSKEHAEPHTSTTPHSTGVADVLGRGLSYPFPLRAEVTITISNIPRDLRAAEVDRIAQFLKALALGDTTT